MSKMRGGFIALTALTMIGATHIAAQEEVESPERRALRRGPSVERIMSMRERLGLTEEQIAQLDQIRAELVQERSAEMAGMAEMRSRLEAGQIRRSEMMAYLEERRDASRGQLEERRTRIEGLLTESQRESVSQMGDRARAFARGQARGRRGQGVRPGRGWDRGERGIRGRRPGGEGRGFRRGPRGGDPSGADQL